MFNDFFFFMIYSLWESSLTIKHEYLFNYHPSIVLQRGLLSRDLVQYEIIYIVLIELYYASFLSVVLIYDHAYIFGTECNLWN